MSPSGAQRLAYLARNPWPKFPSTRSYGEIVAAANDASWKARVYLSESHDPYLNLSIEHYLLQKSPADSTILFLYTNRPCVVLGRNQNPWIEANLGFLRNGKLGVNLVRRRSGGGTVFHDEGNVNYSVICPTSEFNRDKHAEMVAKALSFYSPHKVRVNERHDIVVDKPDEEGVLKPFKVSGSAYKLTRLRSLHHGTCLLSSPNLGSISKYLRAPAKSFIKARGVDSVSSPVTNVGMSTETFKRAVVWEFQSMYPEAGDRDSPFVVFAHAARKVPDIAKGVEELMSDDWLYRQTPQFMFSTQSPATESPEQSMTRAWPFPNLKAEFTAKHGKITAVSVDYNGQLNHESIESSLLNKDLHEITDWEDFLPPCTSETGGGQEFQQKPGRVFNELFGAGNYSPSAYIKDYDMIQT